MTQWTNHESVGFLPEIFLEHDPRTAQEQANERYAHGGGWMSFEGFHLTNDTVNGTLGLKYPRDPVMRELSRTIFHNQYLVLFEGSWLGVIESNGTLSDVARID